MVNLESCMPDCAKELRVSKVVANGHDQSGLSCIVEIPARRTLAQSVRRQNFGHPGLRIHQSSDTRTAVDIARPRESTAVKEKPRPPDRPLSEIEKGTTSDVVCKRGPETGLGYRKASYVSLTSKRGNLRYLDCASS